MILAEAIARSPGNKAEAHNDEGRLVVVQERYTDRNHWWHAWLLGDGSVAEISTPIGGADVLKTFLVDPCANYWQPVK